jgi:hypothetical protein
MSFRLFIYYCALCGGGGAYLGWALGRAVPAPSGAIAQGLKGLFLGMAVALALGLLDAWWNQSLRRALDAFGRVFTAVVVGSMGGLLGGLLGQVLYEKSPYATFKVVGWTLTGLLIGVSLGVFELMVGVLQGQDPRGALRKVRNGILGGAAGGLLGGGLDLAWHALFGEVFAAKAVERLWAPSAWGFVALGACIGLLIGLAQVLLKEAWLKVEAGFRPGREWLLTKPEITLGRAEGCDVGLFGDAGVALQHARISRVGTAFVLDDLGSATGTYVNDEPLYGPRELHSGDRIRMGRSVVRFGERRKAPH